MESEGIYIITGKVYYNENKDILATFGKDFDRGEFDAIIFRPECVNADGAKDLRQDSEVKMRVKGIDREERSEGGDSGRVLVVTEVLEIE